MKKGILVAAAVLAVLLLVAVGAYRGYMQRAAEDPGFFDDEIDAFVAADRVHPPPANPIVFVGSSSIRFWSTLEADMAPLVVLNRGFGGAHLSHVIRAAPRIVIPYAPRAVVVYAGDNDIGSGKTVDAVVGDFTTLVALLHEALPDVDVYFLSIKPSRLRFAQWPEMQRANERIRALADGDPRLHFIDVGTILIGPDGRPRKELFRFDGLHLSAEGYAVWTSVVAPVLRAAQGV